MVPPAELQVIKAGAEEAYPEECCGILVGRQVGLESVVRRAVRTRNGERNSAGRYLIPPEALLEVMTSARAVGEEVIGYFHSHPDREAWPSAADQRESWPGVSYVIVSVEDGIASGLGSWRRIEKGSLEPETVVAAEVRETGR